MHTNMFWSIPITGPCSAFLWIWSQQPSGPTFPFGHQLAPKIFTALSDALVWIVHEFGACFLFKYVDDFASAQPAGSGLCHRDLDAVQAACDLTGFESQEGKSEGPSTWLAVLGVEVDTIAWEMRIGKEKL